MLDNSKGRMFLAGQRDHTETATCRSYDSFGGKPPFGGLFMMKDETLAGGAACAQPIDMDSCIVLLPLVGVLQYRDSLGRSILIAPGELQEVFLPAGASIELSNPYETALVNFLQLRFAGTSSKPSMPPPVGFNIDAHPDTLLPLRLRSNYASAPRLWIGKMEGRQEVVQQLTHASEGVFVFVIQGAFETQYRLLEARDAVALWNTPQVEIEALSNEAIILLVALPLQAEEATILSTSAAFSEA